MSIIAEFSVPAEDFALYETLCEVPEMAVEIECVVAHEEEWMVPYFWTSGKDYTRFEKKAADDPSIRELTKLDEVEGANLYRAEWVRDVETVAYTMTETGATLLDATGQAGQWSMELRFDTRDGTAAFQDYLTENELGAELHRLYEPTQPRLDGQPGLTDAQHETLVRALEEGYYNTPRDVTMSELAETFDIPSRHSRSDCAGDTLRSSRTRSWFGLRRRGPATDEPRRRATAARRVRSPRDGLTSRPEVLFFRRSTRVHYCDPRSDM